MSLLRTENLTKSFGSLTVSKDISLSVHSGERHIIIGPNGAGKTSLVNQLSGQLTPTSGHIFLNDQDITHTSPEERSMKGLARTFQRNNLFRSLTVAENLCLAIQRRRGNPAAPFLSRASNVRLRRRVKEVLEIVHLSTRIETPVLALSYGEQRQLEIALALACEPAVLLLDEPTSGMSPAETEHTVELIASLPRELGILMIEHDMHVVFSLADRITVLYYGEILACGTPDQISADQRVRDVYLGRRQ